MTIKVCIVHIGRILASLKINQMNSKISFQAVPSNITDIVLVCSSEHQRLTSVLHGVIAKTGYVQ